MWSMLEDIAWEMWSGYFGGKTGGGPRAGSAEGRDWLVSMGKKGLRNRLMAVLTREGLYAAVPKGE